MPKIVELIDKVILNHEDENLILNVRNDVNDLMSDFPLTTH
jgi:glycine/serine hydroxymethyltransferase